ncbi:MAG: serine hydrolase [Planctomycetota bacterium]|nr:serine hydrolase [Planctomycetota bacterium]
MNSVRIVLGLLVVLTGGPVAAQWDHRARVDDLAKPLLEQDGIVGFVVGLVHAGDPEVYGFGRTSKESDRAPSGETVYEIGSITKVFTAIILAEMARRELVDLNDPVKGLLPAGVKIPILGEKEITLLHLSTHTSGLPRMPSNFRPKDGRNPYADYGAEQLYDYLLTSELNNEPGEKYSYSNLGVGLLGHALSLRAEKPYEELVVEWIARPLGMARTSITLSEEMRESLAPAHSARGMPVSNWDLNVFAAAGGIRSTTNDLIRFIRAQINLSPEELAPAFLATHQGRFPRRGGEIGLGWHLQGKAGERKRLLLHNGQTGGYHGFVGFDPEMKVGVVVLANSARRDFDKLGLSLLRMLQDESQVRKRPRRVYSGRRLMVKI